MFVTRSWEWCRRRKEVKSRRREAQPPQWPEVTPHFPEQHCALLTHGFPLARQDAARAGVGATSEVTSGKAMAPAIPSVRMTSRREVCRTRFSGSTSKRALDNPPAPGDIPLPSYFLQSVVAAQ